MSIFKVHLKPLKMDADIDTVARKMAAYTPGFTGMSLKTLIIVLYEFLVLGESKKRPTFERLLLPQYVSNDILRYLIE